MEGNQNIKPFSPCKHKFHQGCIEKWTEANLQCPICTKVDADIELKISSLARVDGLISDAERRRAEIYTQAAWSRRFEELEQYQGDHQPSHS
jgi:hypothetical protein